MNKRFSAAGWVMAVVFSVFAAGAAPAPPKFKISDLPIDREARLPASFSPVVKKVAPCVVNIYSSHTIKTQSRAHPFLDDPMFRRFFGDNGGPEDRQRPSTRKAKSLGSGIILTEDGYIVTNSHVVDGADDVKVALADDNKTEYTAKVVGTDPETDIAVLKIEAKGLKAMTLADSDKLEVGDFVLAVGNPFGVGQTVTKGIVSALGRGGFGIVTYEDFIQTDAAINPGNSGGALVDIQGRLIGINQSIMSRNGGNQGIGFAIPINLARLIVERLVTDGVVKHGYLGVMIQSITADLAREFNLPNQQGALVGEVQPNTPAAEAGLKEGDVVTEIDGKTVSDARHLRLVIAQSVPKTKVSLKLVRDGKDKMVSATLGTLPEEFAVRPEKDDLDNSPVTSGALDGVEISDVDARARRQLDIPGTVRGALVTDVESGSSADTAGLRPGDVIVSINRKPVESAETAAALMKKAAGDRLLLRVWSKVGENGAIHYVIIDTSKKK